MADPQQLALLMESLARPAGRKDWLAFKLKAQWIDLAAADFTNLKLPDYDLSDVNLSTAIFLHCNLAGTDFSDAVLTFADLRRADLRNACLDRADLSNSNLQEATLLDAVLEHANLKGCRLSGARLVGADLANADLSGADLRDASLKYVRLTGANIDGADVAGADLTGALLDEDAPARFKNFDLSVIDDRKYRVMRSRLSREQKAREAAESAHRVTIASDQPASAEAGIPIREQEPDLTTIEGCAAVLEIPPDAPMQEIVRVFRKKAKIYHPDMVRHLNPRLQELAAAEFQRLHKAYERLTRAIVRPLTGVVWAENVPRRPSPYDYSSVEYECLARVNPGNTNILYNLAWKYFEEGRHAEARGGFEKLLAISPDDEDAQFNLIIVRLYSEVQLPYMNGADK